MFGPQPHAQLSRYQCAVTARADHRGYHLGVVLPAASIHVCRADDGYFIVSDHHLGVNIGVHTVAGGRPSRTWSA
jgi:hypothetical protein